MVYNAKTTCHNNNNNNNEATNSDRFCFPWEASRSPRCVVLPKKPASRWPGSGSRWACASWGSAGAGRASYLSTSPRAQVRTSYNMSSGQCPAGNNSSSAQIGEQSVDRIPCVSVRRSGTWSSGTTSPFFFVFGSMRAMGELAAVLILLPSLPCLLLYRRIPRGVFPLREAIRFLAH